MIKKVFLSLLVVTIVFGIYAYVAQAQLPKIPGPASRVTAPRVPLPYNAFFTITPRFNTYVQIIGTSSRGYIVYEKKAENDGTATFNLTTRGTHHYAIYKFGYMVEQDSFEKGDGSVSKDISLLSGAINRPSPDERTVVARIKVVDEEGSPIGDAYSYAVVLPIVRPGVPRGNYMTTRSDESNIGISWLHVPRDRRIEFQAFKPGYVSYRDSYKEFSNSNDLPSEIELKLIKKSSYIARP